MSELKHQLMLNKDMSWVPCYLKSEADKVICHHKYKRCLAMAKLCKAEENRLEAISPIFDTDKECWEYNADYWFKWGERWIELAEKFKPNNEVNNA